MRTLFYDPPEVIRLKADIEENLILSETTRELAKDLSVKYKKIAENAMESLYKFQDIRYDGNRKLWLPEIKPLPPIIDLKPFGEDLCKWTDKDKSIINELLVESGLIEKVSLTEQVWITCWICGYTGLYQYNDLYATFTCFNPPCRSWYEIQKNRECPQCWMPKKYAYYYDYRIAPHCRCVMTFQQCMNCTYSVPRAYYYYYD